MTKHTISGISIVNSKLKPLRPALKGWINVVDQYSKTLANDDAIYWYNERPNVGALAAGAWKEGMIAIEEYSNFKGKGKKFTDKSNGRTDLYLSDRNSKYDAVVEAKIAWFEQGKGPIDTKMEAACSDALLNHYSALRIGCVFYVPSWKAKSYRRQAIHEMLYRLHARKLDALAWCFPGASDTLRPTNKKWKHLIYPGVMLGMMIAK